MPHRRTRRTAWRAASAALLVVPSLAAAQSADERLQVHGYASLGFGVADRTPVIGIPTDGGTSDYRAAALQVRYALRPQSDVVIQVANRRFGSSALTASNDVGLDWAFFQHKFATGTTVRAGRVPLVRGIYNETRVVGTLLPFFRAPYNFYTESFTNLDGVAVSQGLEGRGFAVEGTAFGGGFDYNVGVPNTATGAYDALRTRGEQALGAQLWVTTPIPGLRLGANAMRFRLNQRITAAQDARPTATLVTGSVDGTWGRITVRSEVERQHMRALTYDSWYAQAGLKLHERLSIWGQTEHTDVDNTFLLAPGRTLDLTYRYARDHAASANVTLSPNLVLRLEGHRASGFWFDRVVAPFGPTLAPAPAARTSYGLASLAVSF